MCPDRLIGKFVDQGVIDSMSGLRVKPSRPSPVRDINALRAYLGKEPFKREKVLVDETPKN